MISTAGFCWPSAESNEQPHRRGPHDWVVDSGHSSVVFRVKHAKASWFFGMFDKVQGKLTLDPEKPGDGVVQLTIPVDSIDTEHARRVTQRDDRPDPMDRSHYRWSKMR